MKILGKVRSVWAIASLACVAFASVASADEGPRVSFDRLSSWTYEPVQPKGTKKVVRKDRKYLQSFVPEDVYALNGKEVEIVGYMLPLSLNGQKVEDFLLMPDTGACCFGTMPPLNGFVSARAKKGTFLFDNMPVLIRGKFSVEEVWQSGMFSHLYHVDVVEVRLHFNSSPVPEL